MSVKVTADGTLGLYQETIGIGAGALNVNSDVPVTIASPVTVTGALTATSAAVKLRDIQELTTPITGATGATTHNTALAHVFVHSSIAGDFTVNFTNVGLTSGYATNLTLVLQQNGTPRFPTMGTIDGASVTFSWQGNITPTVTAGRTDVVTFSVINSGGTYLVYGQLVSF
jgi:hypothetical protein